jgi:predicted esterase
MNAHTLPTTRTARYYTLGGGGPTEEVWVALHGYGQRADRFLGAFEAVTAPGRIVVAPEALSRFYTDGAHERVGASWMTREDRDAEIADYVAYLDGVLDDARARSGTDETAALTVLGFSQGATTAARWLALSPHLAARRPRADRLVLWGSGPPHDLDLEDARPWLSAVDLTLVVGDQDAYATPERVAEMETALHEADVPHRLVRYPGGHRIEPDVLKALTDG